jgi:hypothetical protein
MHLPTKWYITHTNILIIKKTADEFVHTLVTWKMGPKFNSATSCFSMQ